MIDIIAEWVDWLRVTLAATTVEAYEWELRHLAAWCECDVTQLTRADLARYLSARRVQGAGDATIRRSVNALRNFYAYAFGVKSPARSIRVPTVKIRKQRTLNFDQAFAVMSACDTSTPIGKRNLAIVCLALDSGLRESELCRLSIFGLDLENRHLTVRIKGGDDGDGTFGPETATMLAAWLAIRSIYARPNIDAVFVAVGGDTPGRALTPSGLRSIFRKLGKTAGIGPFSPHDLRRSFATLSHQLGAPTRIVQVGGRWGDVKQVERYTQALQVTDIQRYSPVTHILKLGS